MVVNTTEYSKRHQKSIRAICAIKYNNIMKSMKEHFLLRKHKKNMFQATMFIYCYFIVKLRILFLEGLEQIQKLLSIFSRFGSQFLIKVCNIIVNPSF